MSAETSKEDQAGGAATTGSGRVGNVDVLRAVAALAVVVGHAYYLGGRALPLRAEQWQDVVLVNMASGVYLFFGISGYVISRPFIARLADGRPLPDLVPYALRRAFRIFPLYWIALTAVILIGGTVATKGWQYPVHYALLNNLVPGREATLFFVAWTLTLEVLFYIAVPALALALRRMAPTISPEGIALLVLISWAASIAFTVFGGLQGGGQTALWLRGSLPSMWQMFCPGILLALAPHVRRPAWRHWLVGFPASRRAVLAIVVTLGVAAYLRALAPQRFGLVPYLLLLDASRPFFALGFGLVIAAAIRSSPWELRMGHWIIELGVVSYGIYLLHAVVQDFLLSPQGRRFIPLPHGGAVAFGVHVMLLASLAIVLAMASWRWLERPLVRLAGVLGDRWRASAGDPRGAVNT